MSRLLLTWLGAVLCLQIFWCVNSVTIDDATTQTSTPAPYTKCEYKKKYYDLGQRWQDGPCSSCYCMSTAGNVSICQKACSSYTFVPEQCHLEIPAGKCCQEVKCDFANKCIYKGKYYSEGASWEDGCKSICTCISGSTGMISCQARCPTMQLPAGCQLVEPAEGSGECCPSVHCGGTPVG